jgi:HAD superfamily hydrolase (TIGR01548 family)
MFSSKPSHVPAALVIFDIDGVVRDVAGSYRRAIADTVEHFTQGRYRPTPEDIDHLKTEGCWNNDWEASRELMDRYFERQCQSVSSATIDYEMIVHFFQSKYRGIDFSGYIQDEPLLMSQAYLAELTTGDIPWGFFSGATRASAGYVLEARTAHSDCHGRRSRKARPNGLIENHSSAFCPSPVFVEPHGAPGLSHLVCGRYGRRYAYYSAGSTSLPKPALDPYWRDSTPCFRSRSICPNITDSRCVSGFRNRSIFKFGCYL